MYLSGRAIQACVDRGELSIEPFDPSYLQPFSYDIHLGDSYAIPAPQVTTVQPYRDRPGQGRECFTTKRIDRYRLPPRGFCLVTTLERIKLGRYLGCALHGKSNTGRWGLSIHITAGLADPGYEGNLTLELYNGGHWAVQLYKGMPIGQLTFGYTHLTPEEMRGEIDPMSYDGHFQGDALVGLPY